MRRILILLFISSAAIAQQFHGKIIDQRDQKPVPFALVYVEGTQNGTTADIDGNFTVSLPPGVGQLTVRATGYRKKTIASDLLKDRMTIRLETEDIKLPEIVISPGVNEADRIIERVIKNMPQFDIANLPQYIYNTYSKTYFTLSNETGEEDFFNSDSLKYREEKNLVGKNYLFFMETVTEKKYLYKNKSQEKVTASRISGFKSAPFAALVSELQSVTFYEDNIELLGIKYVNPLSHGTFRRYSFEITDTIHQGNDTIITLRFHPKKAKVFNGLKGTLYINKNQFVLANVLAEPSEPPADGNGVRMQQLYQRIDATHWFPRQVNTEILFYGAKTDDTPDKPVIVKAVSMIYIRDIRLDTAIVIRNRGITAYNEESFGKRDESFWLSQRADSLGQKEKHTYQLVDSIGRKEKFDARIKYLSELSTGRISFGYTSLDLGRILRFNDYEGLRLGCGLWTSDKVSPWVSVGGYGGYGFKDKAWKYGGMARINFNLSQSSYLMGEVHRDLAEAAGTTFLGDGANFMSTERLRDLMVYRMDKEGSARLSQNNNFYNGLRTSLYFLAQERVSMSGFRADDNQAEPMYKFNINETGIQLKYWPGEKYSGGIGKFISMGSKRPALYVNVAKGLVGTVAGHAGEFDYTRVDVKLDHKYDFRVKGYISYQLQAGQVNGNVPYSLQYNNKGSFVPRYFITAEKTFETMRMNEFASSRYVAVFVAINSGKLFHPNKYCNPELELVHNYGIGSLDHRSRLSDIPVNDISKGYTEAGLRIKSIIKKNVSALGVGVYYRYGNYAFSAPKNNVAVKCVFGYSF